MQRAQRNKFVIILSGVFLSACGSEVDISSQALSSTDNHVDEVLLRYCSGCHGLPKPASRTSKEWPPIVWRMQTYRGQRAMPKLTDAEVAEITEYLVKHAKDK